MRIILDNGSVYIIGKDGDILSRDLALEIIDEMRSFYEDVKQSQIDAYNEYEEDETY